MALAQISLAQMTGAQRQLVVRLEHKLVAPCCYSQIVADHMSGEAAQMRQEITEMVASGESEHQIIEAYKARYGEAILAALDGVAGVVAYTVPPLFGLLACSFVFLLLQRWKGMRDRNGVLRGSSLPTIAHDSKILERIRTEVGEW
jgi:cytochrome c-type biogenesis protein CcmH/NrfF